MRYRRKKRRVYRKLKRRTRFVGKKNFNRKLHRYTSSRTGTRL